jgi:hypothetical protein
VELGTAMDEAFVASVISGALVSEGCINPVVAALNPPGKVTPVVMLDPVGRLNPVGVLNPMGRLNAGKPAEV